MTSRELLRWTALHERRGRAGWWTSRIAVAVAGGAAIAGWVAWRAEGGLAGASHAWLAAALVAFALAFMRVPFHLYWRADASLLAQLPIEGGPLFDAALVRCVRAAAATTAATVLGALPIARLDPALAGRHALLALALGTAAGLFMPAVATWAAMVVAVSQRDSRLDQLREAAGVATAGPPSTALLGALPGFAAVALIVPVLLASPWLAAEPAYAPPGIVLGAIAAASVAAILAARAAAPRAMGTILRDVSALDRQRLATLEIRPPTAIEGAIGRLTGAGALAYAKDARLMRRRYPMAFALGALAFLVLAIVGIAQPADPVPWLTVTIAGAAVYAVALARRLHHPPIELARLSATLPIPTAARARAKLAWTLGWWTVFVALPGLFAALRQDDPAPGLLLVGAGTLIAATVGARRQ